MRYLAIRFFPHGKKLVLVAALTAISHSLAEDERTLFKPGGAKWFRELGLCS
jgi:hypothetical protein